MTSLPGHGHDGTDEGLEEMWDEERSRIDRIDPGTENWKIQTLPLARIKKIMKSEEFVLQELEKERLAKIAAEEGTTEVDKPSIKFMISGEAPVLMSKACELLIRDLSYRAWRHTERNRRRTLQRQDLQAAVGESEVYDFLIDIVPRVSSSNTSSKAGSAAPSSMPGTGPGLGATTTTSMTSASMPPGLHMQLAGGMHSAFPVGSIPTASMTAAQSGQADNSSLMQHMSSQQHQPQIQQAHQQQHQLLHQQYQSDPNQQLHAHAQHIPQQQHQQQQTHFHPQQPVQQQQAYLGTMAQDNGQHQTITMPSVAGEQGSVNAPSGLWLPHHVPGHTPAQASSHPK